MSNEFIHYFVNMKLKFQIIMYLLRLGVISSLLSEALVSGFTTGAAIHVFTSQIKDLFGITIPSLSGSFVVIHVYIM